MYEGEFRRMVRAVLSPGRFGPISWACWPEPRCPTARPHPTPRFSRPLAVVTAAVVLLLAGTVALWAHYGTAVFYETILAGIAACL